MRRRYLTGIGVEQTTKNWGTCTRDGVRVLQFFGIPLPEASRTSLVVSPDFQPCYPAQVSPLKHHLLREARGRTFSRLCEYLSDLRGESLTAKSAKISQRSQRKSHSNWRDGSNRYLYFGQRLMLRYPRRIRLWRRPGDCADAGARRGMLPAVERFRDARVRAAGRPSLRHGPARSYPARIA